MCEVIEEYVKEIEAESARRLFENGTSYEVVRTSLVNLSDDELKAIWDDVHK